MQDLEDSARSQAWKKIKNGIEFSRILWSARIKFREFFKIAKIAKFSKNKVYVNHQNRSLHNSFDAKSKLKIGLSDYPI